MEIIAGGVYSIKEVAEYLKVTYGTIYKRVRSGQIPSFKVGSNYRFKGSDIIALTNTDLVKL